MYKTAEEYSEPLKLAKEAFKQAFPEIFDGMKKGEASITLMSMLPYIQPYATHISIQEEQRTRWEGPRVVSEIPGPKSESKKKVPTKITELQMINYLIEHQDLFDEKTQDFIVSLADGYEQYGSFTEKQLPYVIKYYNKAKAIEKGG
ncbi:TPA_asm: hypothetical protein vir520_00021 [Caudoviricetes sp. vir520]|nr:TPA_asm: hypothetical protein vir520_00021 [Caudoviricetes sp. vir520]